jgi:hypothetical protein
MTILEWSRLAAVVATLGACTVEASAPLSEETLEGGTSTPKCNKRWLYPDRDGDGFTLRDEPGLEVCEDAAPPSGFSPASEEPDCDDGDSARFRQRCFDRDGDGAVNPECVGETSENARACPLVVEWTPKPGPYDCDDTDPSRVDYFYVDADGDGVGAGERICLLPGLGYSAWRGDCDDADAARSPRAFEISGDGVDSDCDELDDGRCSSLVPLTEYRFLPSVTVDPGCAGPSLTLGYASCSSCLVANASLAVENRGLTLFRGSVTVSGVDRAIELELEPGTRQLLVSGSIAGEVTLGYAEPSLTDCTPDDNTTTIPGGHCI